jgi:hypothetical protein
MNGFTKPGAAFLAPYAQMLVQLVEGAMKRWLLGGCASCAVMLIFLVLVLSLTLHGLWSVLY